MSQQEKSVGMKKDRKAGSQLGKMAIGLVLSTWHFSMLALTLHNSSFRRHRRRGPFFLGGWEDD